LLLNVGQEQAFCYCLLIYELTIWYDQPRRRTSRLHVHRAGNFVTCNVYKVEASLNLSPSTSLHLHYFPIYTYHHNPSQESRSHSSPRWSSTKPSHTGPLQTHPNTPTTEPLTHPPAPSSPPSSKELKPSPTPPGPTSQNHLLTAGGPPDNSAHAHPATSTLSPPTSTMGLFPSPSLYLWLNSST
jgi:hypothetical protein